MESPFLPSLFFIISITGAGGGGLFQQYSHPRWIKVTQGTFLWAFGDWSSPWLFGGSGLFCQRLCQFPVRRTQTEEVDRAFQMERMCSLFACFYHSLLPSPPSLRVGSASSRRKSHVPWQPTCQLTHQSHDGNLPLYAHAQKEKVGWVA